MLTKIVENSHTDWELKLNAALWAYCVAFKTAIGTTPYNLVFGLDAILPMEFLIPTLRIAKELGWTGHELSNCLTELEQLDEFRLCFVAAMYAQKRRLKKFHDAHIISKEFQKGDLVLAYTLKQHTSKLKKRGMGPYIIHDLSASGAVHLATLDGALMNNWISGCRIKKFHEPLTPELLARLHAAKTRKQRLDDMKKTAQEEAKARALKIRQRQRPHMGQIRAHKKVKICQLTTINGEDFKVRPQIIVYIGQKRTMSYALIDSGADLNTISYETWQSLEHKPQPTKTATKLSTYTGEVQSTIGYVNIDIFIDQTNVCHRFYVMKPGTTETPIIFGTPWQRTYNARHDWRKERVEYEHEEKILFASFISQDHYTDDSDTEDLIQAKSQVSEENTQPQPTGLQQKTIPRSAPVKKPHKQPQSHRQIWLPKATLTKATIGGQIWIPKSVQSLGDTSVTPRKTQARTNTKDSTLRADKGLQKVTKSNSHKHKHQRWVWMPKTETTARNNIPRVPTKATQATIETHFLKKSSSRSVWIRKDLLTQQGYYQGNSCLWVPKPKRKSHITMANATKQDFRLPHSGNSRTVSHPNSIQKATWQEKGKWIPKQSDSATCTTHMLTQQREHKVQSKVKVMDEPLRNKARHFAYIVGYNRYAIFENLKKHLEQKTSTADAISSSSN